MILRRILIGMVLLGTGAGYSSTPNQPPSSPKKITEKPQVKAGTQASQSIENYDKIPGICLFMNPPATSEKLFSPCRQVALQLIYQLNQRSVISIVRTREDGKFELTVPKGTNWTLTSSAMDWRADLDFSKGENGSIKLVVTLKSKGKSQKRRLRPKPLNTNHAFF